MSASLLLSDCFVRDYVTEEKVAELRSGSHSASSYFDTYLTAILFKSPMCKKVLILG